MMKFQQVAAAAVATALGISMAVPAAAENAAAEDRLASVTRAVKETLGIGDEYTEFYGEPNEANLGTSWSLNWSSDNKDLSVTATDTGKILNMNRGENSTDADNGQFGPSFPSMTQDEARKKAEAFLDKVLTAGETAMFDDSREGGHYLGTDEYGFGGTIHLNGIPSPLSFHMWVSVDSGNVTNFWRDDVSEYVGSLPAAETVTTVDAARALLRDTLNMELVYVCDDENDSQAVLRYIPKTANDFYVDATSGSLVNLTELREKMAKYDGGPEAWGSGGAAPMADAEASTMNMSAYVEGARLSEVELSGISKLEGILSKEELDAKVRTWAALKLDGFQLNSCNYSVQRHEGSAKAAGADGADTVLASLSYAKKTDKDVAYRTVTVDARTGDLQTMSGYNPYDTSNVKVSKEDAQTIAADFLSKLWGEQYAKTACYDVAESEILSGSHQFTFAEKANNYFFPQNSIRVRVSAADGAIVGFSRNFDSNIKFDSADNLISLDEAKSAWANLYPVELSYIAVPVELKLVSDDPRVMPLINEGWTYYNTLKPGYQLDESDSNYIGIDAKSGKAVQGKSYEAAQVSYDDINGHWAATALSELASYNIGWLGGKANPDAPLTQKEYVMLLTSADNGPFDPEKGDLDDLYQYAFHRGFLTQAERDDDKVLQRGEMVKMLLDSLGYGPIAKLQGIFRCDYADAADIPADLLGYAALAQGLSLIKGDGAGSFSSTRTSTRAEAAVMLWQYMKR